MSNSSISRSHCSIVALATLLVVVALAYHAAPRNGFHFDDLDNIFGPLHTTGALSGGAGLAEALTITASPRRLVANLSFIADWWRGAGQAAPFQYTNVALHALNAFLLFVLLRLLLGSRGSAPAAACAGALAGAALWALHPIQIQSVTYVVQRMNELATLFGLLALLSYVHARQGARRARAWLAGAGAFFVLALLSKENAATLLGVVLLLEYFVLRDPSARRLSRADWAVLGSLAMLLLALAADAWLRGPVSEFVRETYDRRDFTLSERLLTQPRVIWFHLSQLVWPTPGRFSIAHDFEVSRSLLQPPQTAIALAASLAWVGLGLAALLRPRAALAGVFLLWVPITLSAESSFIGLEMVFEHRMYLPSVGLAGLLALAVGAAWSRAAAPRALALALVLLAGVGLLASTWARVPVWRDELSLHRAALSHAPRSPRVWNALGAALMEAERYAEAGDAFERAIALAGRNGDGYNNRGTLRARKGDYAGAIADFTRALERSPDSAVAYGNRGWAYLQLRQIEQAIADLERAVALFPQSPNLREKRGSAYLVAHRSAEALADFDYALARWRDNPMLLYKRGVALASLGERERAARDFRRACELEYALACGRVRAR